MTPASPAAGRTPLLLAAIALVLATTAVAADADRLVPLAGHRADLAAAGTAAGARRLRMQVHLAPRNEPALDRLLAEQQDPTSPRYHRWLSAAEFERTFGPTQADVDAVARWLERSGFTVTFASAQESRVAFEGEVATVQSAFRTTVAGSRTGRFGITSEPLVPDALAPKIRFVDGLDDLGESTMQVKITAPANNNQLDAPHFAPPDVWVYANASALLQTGMDGTGQCIAALGGSDVDQASLVDFNTTFGLPPLVQGQNFDVVYPDGPPGIAPPTADGPARAYAEAVVDVEWAHGLAPGAQIVLYAGNFPALGTQGLVNGLKAAVADNRCPVITISWAQCGKPKSFFRMLDDSYKRGAAQGQTIFVATGDVGVAGPVLNRQTGGCQSPRKPTIEENAGSPNVTAVGATQVLPAQYDENGLNAAPGVPPEAVWFIDIQHFIKSASTGGVSTVFKKPKFQKGIRSARFKKRAVPDVALVAGNPARPGMWECLDFGLFVNGVPEGATCSTGGGTSIAAPEWAGVLAIIVQKKGARVGNINAQLYAMAKANLANLAAVGIRDVTEGHNGYDPLTGYNAGPGYDLASGWGSIDIGTFVNAFLTFTPPRRR